MATVFFIGRIIFGLYWLKMAYNHFKKVDAMTGYATFKGVPYPRLAVLGGGVLLLLGGLSVLLGLMPHIGLTLLLVFLIPVTFKMHAFWKETDLTARSGDEVQFYKNLGLIGALLMLYMIATPWHYSIGW